MHIIMYLVIHSNIEGDLQSKSLCKIYDLSTLHFVEKPNR